MVKCFLCGKDTKTPVKTFDAVRGRTLNFCSLVCKEHQIGGKGIKHFYKFPHSRKLHRASANFDFYVQSK